MTPSPPDDPRRTDSRHIARLVRLAKARRLRRLRQNLRAAQARFRSLIEGSDAIVWEADADSLRILYVNPHAERLLGYPAQHWRQRPSFWSDVIHPDDRRRVLDFFQHRTRHHDHVLRYRVRAADGRLVWLRNTVVANVDGDTPILRGYAIDITRRQRAREWQQLYAHVLDRITAGAPLPAILDDIVVFAENRSHDLSIAIVLRGNDGHGLSLASAPALVTYYRELLPAAEARWPQTLRRYSVDHPHLEISDILAEPDYQPWHRLATETGQRGCRIAVLGSASGGTLGYLFAHLTGAQTHAPQTQELLRHVRGLATLAIERARNSERLQLAAAVFDQSVEGILITDLDGRIVQVNRAFTHLTGYSAEETVGRTPALLSSGHHPPAFFAALRDRLARTGQWQGEVWNRHKSGRVAPVWMSISTLRGDDGTPRRHISIMVDISEQKAQAERIEQLAFTDPLTGLPNRALFLDRLQQALEARRDDGDQLALLSLDLDAFKEINDAVGHDAGDLVLIALAERLRAAIPAEQTLARLAGDEFVVILPHSDPTAAAAAAEALQRALADPVTIKEQSFVLDANIGIALSGDTDGRTETLLRHADIAMHRAKSGDGVQFYHPDMGTTLARRLELARRLDVALRDGRLGLHYQPQIELRSGELRGAEALLRWHDPEWGWVSPAEFIPIAEDRGLIVQMGEWVLLAACRQLQAWGASGRIFPGRLSINVAAQQIDHNDFAERVLEIVRDTAVNPAGIGLEITESGVMQSPDRAISVMQKLSAAGFGWAIDDFGVGYSSLSYLKRFSAEKLKIDISFVRDMLVDRNDYAIVKAVVTMADSLGMSTIAEGIETAEQARALVDLGCHQGQGYYYDRPQPPEVFAEKWLAAASAKPSKTPAKRYARKRR